MVVVRILIEDIVKEVLHQLMLGNKAITENRSQGALSVVENELRLNEELPEFISNEDFDEVAEVVSLEELGRGDFSIVFDAGNTVVKLMTDEDEYDLLEKLPKHPSLPNVISQSNRYFMLAEIEKYESLPRRWREALRSGIHWDLNHSLHNVSEKAVNSLSEAIDILDRMGVELHDWDISNVMWDPKENVPVLTDLGH